MLKLSAAPTLGRPETLAGAFAARAALSRASVAITFGDRHLSYAALDAASDRLARRLIAAGVGPEVRVALVFERSFEMFVALLGVLKAGGAYVPLDPGAPTERLRFIAQDCGARLVLSTHRLARLLELEDGIPTLCLDATGDAEADLDGDPVAMDQIEPSSIQGWIRHSADNLAYVIYTSGSTGRPKGVAVTHRNVLRLFSSTQTWFEHRADDVWALFHSYAFDVSVWEMWAAWLHGGRLVIIEDDTRRSPRDLLELLRRERVTGFCQTPSAFHGLLQAVWGGEAPDLDLRYLVFAGEALEFRRLAPWYERYGDGPRLVNMWGTTETTVHASYFALDADVARSAGASLVGEAIPDLRLLVLDAALDPVADGEIGEIYVVGPGLSRGYLNRPGLTAERFLACPFDPPGARMYRSGDLARRSADGGLEFLGRADQQVKIRGYRIELGEIEAALVGLEDVAEAAVVPRRVAEDTRLVAYVVPSADAYAPSAADLAQRLAAFLPDYTIPSAFVTLESLPLTVNGKLDRGALPEPVIRGEVPWRPPVTERQARVCDLFAELTGAARVGLDDDFFQIGGHSLLAVTLQARLRRETGLDVAVGEVFAGRTPAAVARALDRADQAGVAVPRLLAGLGDLGLDRIVLSVGQVRIWAQDQIDGPGGAYNVSRAWTVEGVIDHDALGRALSDLIARHGALRTVITTEDGHPVGRLRPTPRPEEILVVEDLAVAPSEAVARVQRRLVEEVSRPFDLSRDVLIRARIFRLTHDHHVLVLVTHHIASDGRSETLIHQDLGLAYAARRHGVPPAWTPLTVTYADHAAWRRQWLDLRAPATRQTAVWRERLKGGPDLLALPTDYPREASRDRRAGWAPVRVSPALVAALRDVARGQGATLFAVLLAGFGTLLGRLARQDDIVIGVPAAGRDHEDIEEVVGYFINTLPLRLDLSGNPDTGDLVARSAAMLSEALSNQNIPFDGLIAECQAPRSAAHTPLFQAMFVLQAVDAASLALDGATTTPLATAPSTAKFDLLLDLTPGRDGGLSGGLEYDASLFAAATVSRWAGYLIRTLEGMAAQPSMPPGLLPILGRDDPSTLAGETRDIPWTSLADLFAARATKSPDVVAVSHGGETVTYAALNASADRLARRLTERGVGQDRLVGVALDRSIGMVIALLGVLKAGGAYLPLDPDYPADRLALIIDEARPVLIVTSSPVSERLPRSVGQLVLDDPTWDGAAVDGETAVGIGSHGGRDPNALAYVIYTSGSTGHPKGVAMAEGPLVNLLAWQASASPLAEGARVLQFASLSFDVAFQDIFSTLTQGGTLVLIDADVRLDPTRLAQVLRDQAVNRAFLPPVVLSALAEPGQNQRFPTLGEVFLAGEAFRISPAIRALAERHPGLRLANHYGPTETHVTLGHALGADPSAWPTDPPIGGPIWNTRVHLLDEALSPVPPGVAGELYLAGAALARGYLNRPAMTAERFIACPFGPPGARMYRTGDLARLRADGAVEFLGRADKQMKIRGYRVEPGEIEVALESQASVARSAVVSRLIADETRLVAYVVPSPGRPRVTAGELAAALRERLPDYMIPAAFVVLESLPLTVNGKLDRGALPIPTADAYASRAFEPPEGRIEEIVASIWAETLGTERVGRQDNFFELGGHSLLAVRVISRVRQALGLDPPVALLFTHPKLTDFAREIRGAAVSELPPITPSRREGPIPLSFTQERLWFLAQIEGASEAYHISIGWRLTGALDALALRRALDQLVARHDALRARFAEVEGEPVQWIERADIGFHLREHDLRGLADTEAEARRLAFAEARASFHLQAGPLVRGRLIRLSEEAHDLLITLHHGVADGWSLGVLARDLGVLYAAFRQGRPDPLPALPIQYTDYALWQRRWLSAEALPSQSDYWRRALADAPPVLELPTDRRRPASQDYAGASIPLDLPESLTRSLNALSTRHRASLFITLIAGWSVVLSRVSGQTDLVIGAPTATRGRLEIEPLIGVFLNSLPLRLDLSGGPDFATLLERVKVRVLEAQQHQDLPFEEMVKIVKSPRNLAHTPVFQVMFVWNNNEAGHLDLPGLNVSPIAPPDDAAKCDLTLYLAEKDGRLFGDLRYATALFDAETVERHATYLRRVLEAVVADQGVSIERLPLLDAAERNTLVRLWNGTDVDDPGPDCIHHLMEGWAARTPEAVALAFEGETLTYRGLNASANRLAHHLGRLGLSPDDRVGVFAERGPGMVVALLAVLKAGCAYLPLDPGDPPERIAFMIGDAMPRLVLTHAAAHERLARALAEYDGPPPVLDLDADARAWKDGPATNPDSSAMGLTGRNLAYVVYTSGSTGRPKGVLVEHRGVVNRLNWMRRAHGLTTNDSILQKTPFGFDVSVREIFLALASGCRLVIARPEGHKDPAYLVDLMTREQITTVNFVPSMLQVVLDAADISRCAALRHVIFAGEALPKALALRVWRLLPKARVFNFYGPTETTLNAVAYEIDEPIAGRSESVPVGRPLANTRIYILDSLGEPAPTGVAGEIYIGGASVSRGYLNLPDLTAERFLPSPFESHERLYRTGDIGRYLPDGAIEFLGRNDFQVKIAGVRVELGEIEARMLEHPGVREAVVLAREDRFGGKRLIAYYTATPDASPVGPDVLRTHLLAMLPAHLAPAAFVRLESLPLTRNGKLDRAALPEPDLAFPAGRRGARDDDERALLSHFEALTGATGVGIDDSFFDLGGHSLLGVRLLFLIEKSFGRRLTLGDVFRTPTVAGLAQRLRSAGAPAGAVSLVPLHTSGEGAPVFMIHWIAPDLARRLGARRPVYALSFGLGRVGGDDDLVMPERVEDIAAAYIRDMKSVQPSGPYTLIGFSAGGLVAFEMARQLRDSGEPPGFVGLLDTHLTLPTATPRRLPPLHVARNLARTPWPVLWRYLSLRVTYAVAVSRLLRRWLIRVLPSPATLRLRLLNTATRRYAPRPYAGRVHLFKAMKPTWRIRTEPPPPPDLSWAPFALGGLVVREIYAEHLEMVKGPLAEVTADAIEATFDG